MYSYAPVCRNSIRTETQANFFNNIITGYFPKLSPKFPTIGMKNVFISQAVHVRCIVYNAVASFILFVIYCSTQNTHYVSKKCSHIFNVFLKGFVIVLNLFPNKSIKCPPRIMQ